MKRFRTEEEREVGKEVEKIFTKNPDSIEIKLENFPKYVRRQHLKRFLTLYEIYKKLISVKGSIIELGVFRGFSLTTWAKLSAIMEPENLIRKVYGFDTYEGFPSIHKKDITQEYDHEVGHFYTDVYEELTHLNEVFNKDRFLGHINKIELIKGDCTKTIPDFLQKNPHLLVGMLFIDLDLYEPTYYTLNKLWDLVVPGGVIVFDEYGLVPWGGEATAFDQFCKEQNIEIELKKFDWCLTPTAYCIKKKF